MTLSTGCAFLLCEATRQLARPTTPPTICSTLTAGILMWPLEAAADLRPVHLYHEHDSKRLGLLLLWL